MSRPNVYDDEPDMTAEKMKIRSRFVGKAAGAKELGASVHELLPGSTGFHLHAHYGMEELFVVLSGRPTLRTGGGEEELGPGDVVSMPRGIEGLHTFTNPTDEPARVLAISTMPEPEVVLYPEIGKFGVATRDPFTPVADGGDEGIVGLFDLPDSA
ncbi:MAG TPA: cupin domain-containing protein [Gaiellaceae bacterium]|nr:cupin domain-containing protein [Gaiellaceae bacterium]